MEETILIVSPDAAEREQLGRIVRQLGFKAWTTSSRDGAVWVVRNRPVGLLLGVVEPAVEQDAAWLEELWRARFETPVVFLGSEENPTVALESLELGALDFIPRFTPPEVTRRRLEQALARRRRWMEDREGRLLLESLAVSREQALHGTYRQVLEALGAALDTRHPETQDHTRRVIDTSIRIAQEMGVRGDTLREIEWGAALHDVGKIGIPDAVLLKPASLTPEEWVTMKSHCEIGYRMLSGISFLRSALPIVLHHHERFDGAGYPFGLAGEEIPFGARVFAVVDSYDAMTSDRPYRPAMAPTSALGELLRCAGSQFDPVVVQAFVSVMRSDLGTLAHAA